MLQGKERMQHNLCPKHIPWADSQNSPDDGQEEQSVMDYQWLPNLLEKGVEPRCKQNKWMMDLKYSKDLSNMEKLAAINKSLHSSNVSFHDTVSYKNLQIQNIDNIWKPCMHVSIEEY